MEVSSLVSVQLDRAEYVFLLRLSEHVLEAAALLAHQEALFSR